MNIPQDSASLIEIRTLINLQGEHKERQYLAKKFRKLSELIMVIDESILTIASTKHDYTMIHEETMVDTHRVRFMRHWDFGLMSVGAIPQWVMITSSGKLATVHSNDLYQRTVPLELLSLTIFEIKEFITRINEMVSNAN